MAASSGASFRGEGAHRDGTARAASFHSDFAASIGGAEVDELLILDGRFDVGTLTREQLVHELARRELDTSGTKAVLASRFVSYVTDKLAWRVADAIGTVQQKLDLTEQEQRGSLYVAGKLVDIVDGEGPAHAFHLCHQFRGVPVAELAAGTDFALILTSMQQVFIIALPGSPCAVHTSKKLPPLVPTAFRGALNTAATDFMAAKTLGEATRHTAATNNSGAGIGAPTATRLNNASVESLAATLFSSNLLDSSVGNGHTVSRTLLEPGQLRTGGSWASLRHDAGAASVYETERQDAAFAPHALHEGAGVGPEHKRTAQGVSALLPSTNASMLATKRPLPIVIVPGTEGEHVNHIFAAGSYASAVSEGGDAFMWGSGRLGMKYPDA
ncbi:MAG: hypothetical protein EOO65_02125 [Methanosarcinales archaeon]|nr:MAG: hypothetical protein EOO65_02125 [Methanosarcinales archaeon]